MKKVFSIFMTLFFMSSTAFASVSSVVFNACHDYANNAVQGEMDAYGPMSSADEIEAYVWYYDACDEAGAGNILDPVFL